MNLVKRLLPFVVVSIALSVYAEDVLLLRNGDEYRGKLNVISEQEVAFQIKKGSFLSKSNEYIRIPTDEVYMVKTDKRGTVFFSRNRERKMVSGIDIPKGADVVYLADGGEIPCWQISVANGILSYQKDAKQKKAMSNVGALPIEDVFMVKYSDGSKDIFENISALPTIEDKNIKEEERKIKVIMHKVKAGETLTAISEKYDVSVENIVDWNELPANTKGSNRPKVGTQLMIQTYK